MSRTLDAIWLDGAASSVEVGIQPRTSGGRHTDNTGAAVQAADAVIEMSFRQGATGTVGVLNDFDEGYAIANDGTYLAFDADGTVLANNVFGHACLTAGIVRTMTGFIPEVPVP